MQAAQQRGIPYMTDPFARERRIVVRAPMGVHCPA